MKMKIYKVKLRSDRGIVNITTNATSEASARKIVADSEGAPESAIISVTERKGKLKMASGGKITADDAGVWVDDHHGIYIGQEIIKIAEGMGFPVEDEDAKNRTPDGANYNDLWDEAVAYINEYVPEGYYFGTLPEGGDWGLWTIAEGEEEMAKGGLTRTKARQILHDKKVHGKPLTDKQRKYMGAVASGYAKAEKGGELTGKLNGRKITKVSYPKELGTVWDNIPMAIHLDNDAMLVPARDYEQNDAGSWFMGNETFGVIRGGESKEQIGKLLKSASKHLVGKKIIEVDHLSPEELKHLGWFKNSVILVLNDGSGLFVSKDDEGNDGGALFLVRGEDWIAINEKQPKSSGKKAKGGNVETIDGTKKYKYSITYRTITEESAEQGDWADTGYEVEETKEELQYIIKTASWDYGIREFTGSWWESTSPNEDKDYFEKGIEKYYDLHITHADGSELSSEEEKTITELLKSNKVRYDEDEKKWYGKGGEASGGKTSGINWIITGTHI